MDDILRRLSVKLIMENKDLWLKLSKDNYRYDYISTHVDDIIIVAKNNINYMESIGKEFFFKYIDE